MGARCRAIALALPPVALLGAGPAGLSRGLSRGFVTVKQRNAYVGATLHWTKSLPQASTGSKGVLPRHELRSFSVGSIAQQALDASTGFLAFAGKTYAFLLLVVYLLQRKLIFLPSKQLADPRAYSSSLQVIQLPGPEDTNLAAIYFEPKPSKPVVVPLVNHGRCVLFHLF